MFLINFKTATMQQPRQFVANSSDYISAIEEIDKLCENENYSIIVTKVTEYEPKSISENQ